MAQASDADKTTGELPNTFEGVTDDDLLGEWASIQEHMAIFYPRLVQIEHEVVVRLNDRKAKTMAHPHVEVKYEAGTSIDRTKLKPILALPGLPAEKLAEAYKPPHNEPVPEAWNLGKVNALKKFNGEVETILKAAEVPVPASLRLKWVQVKCLRCSRPISPTEASEPMPGFIGRGHTICP